MVRAEYQLLKQLFHTAIDLNIDERSTFLQQVRCDSPELSEHLKALLEERDRTIIDSWTLKCDAQQAFDDSLIGPYKVLRLIGSGGSGRVFLAHRSDDEFQRLVAVKLLSSPLTLVADEFSLSERAALSRLQHPNIAALFDWGVTATGTPWLATEYVDGLPIDQHCRAQGLDLEEILTLFCQLCEAVSYAHRHLLLHLDLKPDNILVDGSGRVKLLDFGAATAKTTFESTDVPRQISVLYASPEQIQHLPLTTASDVYSLGVVLFRCLSSELPYATADTGNTSDWTQLVLNGGTRRLRETQALQKWVSPELEAIVSKSLAKALDDRYSTAEQLRDEIRRYLNGRDVCAYKTGALYRGRKFILRNRVLFSSILVAAAALLVGTGIAVWKAHEARAQALLEERRVAQLTQVAHHLIAELPEMLQSVPGGVAARQLSLQTALRHLEEAQGDGVRSEGLQKELGLAYLKLGDLQGEVEVTHTGRVSEARSTYHKAIRLFEAIWSRNKNDPEVGSLLAETYGQLGHIDTDLRAGTEDLERAIAISAALEKTSHLTSAQRLRTAGPYFWMGEIRHSLGDLSGERSYYESYIGQMQELQRAEPENWRPYFEIGTSYERLAISSSSAGSYSEALQQASSAMSSLNQALLHSPKNREAVLEISSTYQWMADALRRQGRFAEAESDMERSQLLAGPYVEADPSDHEMEFDLAWTDIELGDLALDRQRYALAYRQYSGASALLQKCLQDDANRWLQYAWVKLQTRLGLLELRRSHLPQAAAHFQEAHRKAGLEIASSPRNALFRVQLAIASEGLLQCEALGQEEGRLLRSQSELDWEQASAACPDCVEVKSHLRTGSALDTF